MLRDAFSGTSKGCFWRIAEYAGVCFQDDLSMQASKNKRGKIILLGGGTAPLGRTVEAYLEVHEMIKIRTTIPHLFYFVFSLQVAQRSVHSAESFTEAEHISVSFQ